MIITPLFLHEKYWYRLFSIVSILFPKNIVSILHYYSYTFVFWKIQIHPNKYPNCFFLSNTPHHSILPIQLWKSHGLKLAKDSTMRIFRLCMHGIWKLPVKHKKLDHGHKFMLSFYRLPKLLHITLLAKRGNAWSPNILNGVSHNLCTFGYLSKVPLLDSSRYMTYKFIQGPLLKDEHNDKD